MIRFLPTLAAVALGWGAVLAWTADGRMGGVPRAHVSSGLILLGLACACAVLTGWPRARSPADGGDGDRAPSSTANVVAFAGLGLAALLGPVSLAVAVALVISRRVLGSGAGGSGHTGRATAAGLASLSATALGAAVLVDAWRGLSPLGLPWGDAPPVVPDLPSTAWLLLLVPGVQAFCASLTAPEGVPHERRGEHLPLLLTFVMAMLIVGAVVFAWRDAPWTTGWGQHWYARAHAAGVLALLGAVRLVVVVAEHPAAPRAVAVSATSLAAVGALTFGFTDSLLLALPALLGSLVIGRPARRGRRVRVIGSLRPAGGRRSEDQVGS
jgi:hypothetical protein